MQAVDESTQKIAPKLGFSIKMNIKHTEKVEFQGILIRDSSGLVHRWTTACMWALNSHFFFLFVQHFGKPTSMSMDELERTH